MNHYENGSRYFQKAKQWKIANPPAPEIVDCPKWLERVIGWLERFVLLFP